MSVETGGSGGSDDSDLFVLDTEGSEIVQMEEVNKKNLSVITTPNHGLEKEERKVLLKTPETGGKSDVFDVTKILTNDAVLPSSSEEKKERLFVNTHKLEYNLSFVLHDRKINISNLFVINRVFGKSTLSD